MMGHLLHNIQIDENKNESKIKIELENHLTIN
jgi:hypothetical protein